VGLYHSFTIHKKGDVYAWGSNNFGQTGVTTSAGQNDAIVAYPNKVPGLKKYGPLVSISGGKDHSMAITEQGECLIWGRIDNKALGIALEDMPQTDIIYDTYDRPRILKRPNLLTGVGDKITFGTAGTDHSFVVTESGKAYSWGFNAQCQAGQPGLDEVERPTLLHSKYLEGKKLVSATAGGQFSVVFGEHSIKDSCM
jgi:regulator of chromosome condensation